MFAKVMSLMPLILLAACSSTSTNPELFGNGKDAGSDALGGAAGLAGAAGTPGGSAGAAGAPEDAGGAAGSPSGGAGGVEGGGAAGAGGTPPDPCDECKCYKPAYSISECWGSNWFCQCPKECSPNCKLNSSYSTCTIWPQGCSYWCCEAAP